MTKKDYQAIARALNGSRSMHCSAEDDQWQTCVVAIADAMQPDNPRFDRERFIEACETGRCKGMPK